MRISPPKINPGLILNIILLAVSQLACADYAGQLINTHAQYDEQIPLSEVVGILKANGVSKVLLSGRGQTTNQDLIKGARHHSGFLYPLIRTKTEAYRRQDQGQWKKYINKTSRSEKFTGFQELLLYHAAKKNHKGGILAPEISVAIDDPRIEVVVKAAQRNHWPIPLHFEFRGIGEHRRQRLIRQLRNTLKRYAGQNFTLMHMGQLAIDEVRSLLNDHDNIYFQLSMTANVYRDSHYPWTVLFEQSAQPGILQPQWKEILEEHPERFLLAFDGVFSWIWRDDLPRDIAEWRAALGTLPPAAADLIAHKNAQRLWPALR
jgi:hypothetical protein